MAQVEVADPGITLANVAEFGGVVGPGRDFQEDLGQVHAGQPRGHAPAQFDQARHPGGNHGNRSGVGSRWHDPIASPAVSLTV